MPSYIATQSTRQDVIKIEYVAPVRRIENESLTGRGLCNVT